MVEIPKLVGALSHDHLDIHAIFNDVFCALELLAINHSADFSRQVFDCDFGAPGGVQGIAVTNGVDCDGQMFARNRIVRNRKLAGCLYIRIRQFAAGLICRYSPSATVRPNRYVFPGRNHSRRPSHGS